MNVALVGFDTEGRASYEYFTARGDSVTICDKKTDITIPDGAKTQLGDAYLDNLDAFDLIVRTPGLPPSKILSKNPGVAEKITSGTNEFFKACPSRNIIGVTGTKGKGTTSSLIAAILQSAGKTVHLGGNIGVPALSFVHNIQPDDWVVLELSSFQLIDLHYSPHIGVCVMIAPEHLNWHTDYDEYVGAKNNLFAQQTADDIAIYFAHNEQSQVIASAGDAAKIPYFKSPGAFVEAGQIKIGDITVCQTEDLQLVGEHNWQNVCAAVTVAWQITQDVAAIHSAITSFSGLPYRLELIHETNGVKYYNDSFGTTPETALVAIEAFQEPKIVILGGSDKGASYDELAYTIAHSNVKTVVTIGETAADITAALQAQNFSHIISGGNTMSEVVQTAHTHAEPGDVVLLSPASASFDMFKNYKDRGDQFNQAVQSLASAQQ